MTAFSEYIAERENLFPVSLGITAGILLLLFLIAQMLSFWPLHVDNSAQKKMQVKELVKLRFDRTQKPQPQKKTRSRVRRDQPKKNVRVVRKAKAKSQQQVDVASLVKDFDRRKLLSNTKTHRKTVVKVPGPAKAGLILDDKPLSRNGVTANDLKTPFRSRPSRRRSGRRARSGLQNGTAVEVGAVTANIGEVNQLSADGIAGKTAARVRRGVGKSDAAQISLPSGEAGGKETTINLNELIEWMKAHPGPIPKLVAHEMGHQRGDLSSRIQFTLNGRRYVFFLSCNEHELLLRVCMVEGNDFILLKDSGIQEESHFLTVGDVVRQRGRIQSLISSRKAPGERANRFYSIFWQWWAGVKKRTGK